MDEYRKKYYRNNRRSELQRIKNRKREMKQKYQALKSTLSCSRCGFKGEDAPWAIDFHHINPESKNGREDEVGWLVKNGYSWHRVLEEIEKCIPICANCHRTIHWLEHHGAEDEAGLL